MSNPKFVVGYMGFYIRKKAEDKKEVHFIHEDKEIICVDLTEAKRKIEEIMGAKPKPQTPQPTHKSLPSAVAIKKT